MSKGEEKGRNTSPYTYLVLVGVMTLYCVVLTAFAVAALLKSDQLSMEIFQVSKKYNELVQTIDEGKVDVSLNLRIKGLEDKLTSDSNKINEDMQKIKNANSNETGAIKQEMKELKAESQRIDQQIKENKASNDKYADLMNDQIKQLISADNKTAIHLKQLRESDKQIEKKIADVSNETASSLSQSSKELRAAFAKGMKLYAKSDWKISGDGNVVYKCFTDSQTNYATANATCHGLGGRLATKALRDLSAVTDILASKCDSVAWIGYFEIEGDWRWADGGATNNSTAKWQTGEPNSPDDKNDCGETWGGIDGKVGINDVTCSIDSRSRICEIDL